MARHKVSQIPLVSADGPPQPPFPGGWVLAVFAAIDAFAPELSARHRLPVSRQTEVRVKRGDGIKRTTYEGMETMLVRVVSALFPKVSAVNQFASKYVDEYFRLWKASIEIAPDWAQALGFEPIETGVLARALVRDLALRLCYLESCERALGGKAFEPSELDLLGHESPALAYAAVMAELKKSRRLTVPGLVRHTGVNEKKLRLIKNGRLPPCWPLLRSLAGQHQSHRVLAGVGFIDMLTRKLGLGAGQLPSEILCVAEALLPAHQAGLSMWRADGTFAKYPGSSDNEQASFAHFAARKDNLLLHPGFDEVWARMPDALWRAHVYTLQYARVVDLAHAYFQFAEPKNDRKLTTFLDAAERTSGNSPHRWLDELQTRNNVVPYAGDP